jgi:hypothetical protein
MGPAGYRSQRHDHKIGHQHHPECDSVRRESVFRVLIRVPPGAVGGGDDEAGRLRKSCTTGRLIGLTPAGENGEQGPTDRSESGAPAQRLRALRATTFARFWALVQRHPDGHSYR